MKEKLLLYVANPAVASKINNSWTTTVIRGRVSQGRLDRAYGEGFQYKVKDKVNYQGILYTIDSIAGKSVVMMGNGIPDITYNVIVTKKFRNGAITWATYEEDQLWTKKVKALFDETLAKEMRQEEEKRLRQKEEEATKILYEEKQEAEYAEKCFSTIGSLEL